MSQQDAQSRGQKEDVHSSSGESAVYQVNPDNGDIENPGDIIVDVEHIPRRYIWRSCCLILDSRAVLFFSQLAISVVIMLFCIRQMVVLEDTDAQKNYGILLSFIIGLWFPAPKIGA